MDQKQDKSTLNDQVRVFGFVIPSGVDAALLKQTMLSVLTVVFLAMAFILFVYPRFADLNRVSEQVAQLEKRKTDYTRTLLELDNFSTRVSETDLANIYSAIPASFDPGLILMSLRQIAFDNGVNIASYEISGGKIDNSASESAKPVNGVVQQKVKLELDGASDKLLNYVDRLDRYLPVVAVSNLSISEISKVASSNGQSRLALELTYYFMPTVSKTGVGISGKYLTDTDYNFVKSLMEYNHLSSGKELPVYNGPEKESLFTN